jgi:hypothetical protein
MRRRVPLSACAFIFALLTSALIPTSLASACSVRDSYRVPTNLELVERADTILLGVVEGGTTEAEEIDDWQVVVRPTLLLKGEALPAELRFHRMGLAPPRFHTLSDPSELEQAHPLAYIGGCVRYMFVQGSTVLLFLERHEGEMVPLFEPFARSAEDVPSHDSRWVRTVRLYIEVAALPEAERAAALRARQAELRALSGDADAQAIADDIDRQLRGPNRSWNAIRHDEIERVERQSPAQSRQ